MRVAAGLARQLDAQVTLLHVIEPVDLLGLPDSKRGAVLDRARRWADTCLGEARAAFFDEGTAIAHVEIRSAGEGDLRSVSHAIVTVAREREISTVVMGTHGRRGFTRLLLGSASSQVVRHAPCEVITVLPADDGSAPRGSVERILCGVDFSPGSRRALARAADLAQRLGADLHVAHAFRVEAQLIPDFPIDRVKLVEARAAELAALAAPWDELVGPQTHLVEGDGARELVRLAEDLDAQLIVVGTLGRTGLPHLMIGSVAERVVRSATRPVLTVRGSG